MLAQVNWRKWLTFLLNPPGKHRGVAGTLTSGASL
jgi:hypothetical protein